MNAAKISAAKKHYNQLSGHIAARDTARHLHTLIQVAEEQQAETERLSELLLASSGSLHTASATNPSDPGLTRQAEAVSLPTLVEDTEMYDC